MKAEQRKLAKSILENLKDRKEKSSLISQHLLKLLNKLNFHKQILGCYSPMPNEPDWFLSFENEDFRYALPNMEDEHSMSFYLVEEKDIFSRSYNLKFDSSDLSLVVPDICLIPGLAFSEDGKRLGRGKGYFDRYLEEKNIIKIGVCFQEQIFGDITTDSFDIGMNYIVTDKNVFKGIK